MARLLLRTAKDPRQPFNAYDSLERDTFGGNSGNVMFASGAHRLLSAEGVRIDNAGLGVPSSPQRVNETYDAFVLPMANALRGSYQAQLERLATFIEQLTIPVVLLSIGAQSGPDGTFDNLSRIDDTVKRLFRAVLDRSSEITVRGEHTAAYVRGLGFNDVTVIGCPSLTLAGPNHTVPGLEVKDRYKIAYNVQTRKDMLGALVADIESRADATYVPQDKLTLEMMLWGGPDPYPGEHDPRLPLTDRHRQFSENRARFLVDASVWSAFLGGFDLAIGPRIHGSVAAVLGGTPALVLAHDTRTEELASYHEIPHTSPAETASITRLEDVLDRFDFSGFNQRQPERFQRVIDFLRRNSLTTIYDSGQEEALVRYDREIAEAPLADPIGCAWSELPPVARERLGWLRERDLTRARQVERLTRELAKQRQKTVAARSAAGTTGAVAPSRRSPLRRVRRRAAAALRSAHTSTARVRHLATIPARRTPPRSTLGRPEQK